MSCFGDAIDPKTDTLLAVSAFGEIVLAKQDLDGAGTHYGPHPLSFMFHFSRYHEPHHVSVPLDACP